MTSTNLLTPTEAIVLLWRRKWIVVIVALVMGGAGLAWRLSDPRLYEATTMLAVTAPKTGEQFTGTILAGNYRPIVQSVGLAGGIVTEFSLDRPPYNLTPTRFLQRVLSVEDIRQTTLIRVQVVLPDPALAAQVANRVGERAVEAARRLSQDEAVRTRDEIGNQLAEARSNLERLTAELTALRRASQVELVRRDVESMLQQRGELLGLAIEIEGERARLSAAEQQLAGRERIDVVRRTIDDDPALVEASRSVMPAGESVIGLQLRSELINPVYQAIEGAMVESRRKLADLEARQRQATQVRQLDSKEQAVLSRLYELEAQLAQATAEQELARVVFAEIAKSYEVARLQVASRSAQLQVIDAAVATETPLPRGGLRVGVLSTVLGALLAVLGILGTELTRRFRSLLDDTSPS